MRNAKYGIAEYGMLISDCMPTAHCLLFFRLIEMRYAEFGM